MDGPLVSVNMITYNHKKYISKAIESVLAQKTNFSFELVIGDDCSTDGTREVVLEYARKYPNIIRLVISEHNVGMHANFCRTVKSSNGMYIAFCEGDDYWHNESKLQIQIDYLLAHPECGLVHSDQDRYFENNDIIVKNFFQITGNIPPDNANLFRGWNGYNVVTCTVMVLKNIVDKIITDQNIYQNSEYIGGVDIPLFIETSMVSEVHYLNISLATYTVRNNSASHIIDRGKAALFSRSVLWCYLYLAQKYDLKDEYDVVFNRYVELSVSAAFWNKDIGIVGDFQNELTFKQRLMCLGAVSALCNFIIRPMLSVKYMVYEFRSKCLLKRLAVPSIESNN